MGLALLIVPSLVGQLLFGTDAGYPRHYRSNSGQLCSR
jgi:hypothetical protein